MEFCNVKQVKYIAKNYGQEDVIFFASDPSRVLTATFTFSLRDFKRKIYKIYVQITPFIVE